MGDAEVEVTHHHPDCPALFFTDHPERCRCAILAMLDAQQKKPAVDALTEILMASVVVPGPMRFRTNEALVLTNSEARRGAEAILASDWFSKVVAEARAEGRAEGIANTGSDVAAAYRAGLADGKRNERERIAQAIDGLLSSEDAHAVLSGATGTHPESCGGVTKDEALECAGSLLDAFRELVRADREQPPPPMASRITQAGPGVTSDAWRQGTTRHTPLDREQP